VLVPQQVLRLGRRVRPPDRRHQFAPKISASEKARTC
jgi:hypothetical protein